MKKYFKLIHEHSLECKEKEIVIQNNNKIINEWEEFKNLCFNYL